ncbi:hypothetical protein AgCh_021998 [Apium graveolens]
MTAQLKCSKRIKRAFANVLLFVCTRLHTICDALHSCDFGNEHQVENAIAMVYKNLTNNEHRDIHETDLLGVIKTEEITDVLQLFQGAAETKSVSEASATIASLTMRRLLGSNPASWHAEQCFDLLGIDDVKAKYNLVITHDRKFHNYNEKKYQRSEFVQNLRTILEELNVQNFTIQ